LSAAVAANLARGMELDDAVEAARAYLRHGLEHGLRVGQRRFINHRP
jgi:hydroxymethylpyrimidine/phosphomethylpyrimidine kinase